MAGGLMLLTTFFWAANIVAGKMALLGFSALALAQLRMAAAALLYWIIYVSIRGLPSLRPSKRQWLILGAMALTGITLNQIFYIGGLAKTSVTHAGLIQAIGPVMVLLLASSVRMESLTLQKIAGMVVSFAGVAVLLVEKPGKASGAHWTGDLLMIAAGAVFAVYTILMKEVAHLYDTLTLNAMVFGIGAVLLIPFCARATARAAWGRVSAEAWLGLAFMVLFGSLAAYLIYGFALQKLSASTVASFSYLQPVMAAALGVWLLAEHITVKTVVGGAIILAGVFLTEHARGTKRHVHHLATGKV
ncbi:MAG: DMT family transporter [Terriglobia bacterium]